jgi:hypothetical protein
VAFGAAVLLQAAAGGKQLKPERAMCESAVSRSVLSFFCDGSVGVSLGGVWVSSAPGAVHAASDSSSSRAWRRAGVTVHKGVYQMIHQQNAHDDDTAYIQPLAILDDLHVDNKGLLALLKEARACCNGCLDIATASLIEIWIAEAARRNWVFSQAVK